MRRSKFYNMRLPERGAREGEANDAADIEDLTYDLGIIDAEMERQRLEDVRLEKDKATKLELSQHKSAAVLDHPDNSVTDAKLGQRTVLTTSGPLQTLLTAIGNAIKAISGADTWNGTPATTLKDAKTHMGDAVKHITAQERESWNAAATVRHSHTNKSVLDGITAAMVTAWNTVSSKLPLAGGTLTGFLTLHAAPATDMHAATKKYVDDKMAASGSGDMTKAVYDPGGRELPYIPKQDVDALAWGGDFGASGTPVSIAYAGANRIDALNLYGENAQGGTTEAPVALTGVENVFVGGRNLLRVTNMAGETQNGITFTPEPDGRITVSGTATSDAYYTFADKINSSLFGQTVCLSGGSALARIDINERTPNSVFVRNLLSDWGTSPSGILSKKSDENIIYAVLYVKSGTTINTSFYPMLNLGKSPLPYEPYSGSITALPIPRPLRRVGDVKDKCVTRVKSVYDKHIVFDGSVDEAFIQTNKLDDWIQIAIESDAVIPESTSIVGSIKSSYLKAYAIEEVYSKKYSGISVDSNRRIRLSFKTSEYPDVTSVETARTYLSAHPLTVYYQSTTYDGTNGLPVCLTEYQTGFVELDGTESQFTYAATETKGLVVGLADDLEIGFLMLCSHGVYSSTGTESIRVWRLSSGKVGIYLPESLVTPYGYDGTVTTVKSAAAGYFAAQKEAGTPVQIAYQFAAPETYATDPLDFDNAAGPLTVMTGGELEVRMTELVGSRSPEIVAKMDKATYDTDGDGVVDRAGSVDGGTY